MIKLSKRQLQILNCLEFGMSNHEISIKLNISEHTVKVHMWRLFKKINVSSRIEALIFFQKMKDKTQLNDTRILHEEMLSVLLNLFLYKTFNSSEVKKFS